MVNRQNRPGAISRLPLGSRAAKTRGGILITTMIMITLMTVIALAVFDSGLSAYKLSMRNQTSAAARSVAESELEFLYFRFKSSMLSGAAANNVPSALSAAGISDNASLPTNYRTPFLTDHQTAGWRVRRSLAVQLGPLSGRIPGTTKTGDFTYLTARVEVYPPVGHAMANSLAVRVGRRFINSNTTIFQYSIFFEGDVELNPGSDTVIDGDIVASGNIYLGPMSGRTLTINNQLRYVTGSRFNTDADGNASYFNPDTVAPPVTIVAPTFATSEASQVETLDEPENLLGGLDAVATAQARPDLFGPAGANDSSAWTPAHLEQAVNNVYRSMIVPPPSAASATEFPNATPATGDDPVINVARAYTRASLIIDVSAAGVPTIYKSVGGLLTNVSATYSSALSTPSPMYDLREAKNVALTQVDVGALATLIAADVSFNFNGLLYVNLRNSTSTNPAAIRLVNAATTPQPGDKGFSVATNGGLYVKGDYNTTPVTFSDGSTGRNPAMLMADAITVLSSSWNDANAAAAMTSRVATAGSTTINAGLLTGNISSTASNTSGGAQNLVRYLENWSGQNVTFMGSLGRLFKSTQMIAPYGGVGTVYMPPARTFSFDQEMVRRRPPGSPTTTAFSRGSFFVY